MTPARWEALANEAERWGCFYAKGEKQNTEVFGIFLFARLMATGACGGCDPFAFDCALPHTCERRTPEGEAILRRYLRSGDERELLALLREASLEEISSPIR